MTVDDLYFAKDKFEKAQKELTDNLVRLNRESHAALLAENARLRELAGNLRGILWYQRSVGMREEQVELFYNTLTAMESKLCSSQNPRFHCGECLQCKPYTIGGRTYGGMPPSE